MGLVDLMPALAVHSAEESTRLWVILPRMHAEERIQLAVAGSTTRV